MPAIRAFRCRTSGGGRVSRLSCRSTHGAGHGTVTTFLTGSSAPPARRALPRFTPRGPALRAGASRPSSRVPPATRSGHEERVPRPPKRPGHPQLQHRHRHVTVRHSTDLRAADPTLEDLHAAARRQWRCASLRDGLWPPLTPDTDEQEGWLSGRWLSHGHDRERVAPRAARRVPHVFPRPGIQRNRGTRRRRSGSTPKCGEAFAMRRSGVRIPSAPPNRNPAPPAGTSQRRRGFVVVTPHSSALAHPPAPTGALRRSKPARLADDQRWCR
jgi:hypothetical protein